MKTSGKSADELIEMSAKAREIVAQDYSAEVEDELSSAAGESAAVPGGSVKYAGKVDGVVWQVVMLSGGS